VTGQESYTAGNNTDFFDIQAGGMYCNCCALKTI
jgi:hypothetical protein